MNYFDVLKNEGTYSPTRDDLIHQLDYAIREGKYVEADSIRREILALDKPKAMSESDWWKKVARICWQVLVVYGVVWGGFSLVTAIIAGDPIEAIELRFWRVAAVVFAWMVV